MASLLHNRVVLAGACTLYVAWALTFLPAALAAQTFKDAWHALRVPLWSLLIALAAAQRSRQAAGKEKSSRPTTTTTSATIPSSAPVKHTPSQATQLKIFYGSLTGTAETLAKQLAAQAKERGQSVILESLQDYDAEQLPDEKGVCVFLVATYEHGQPPPAARWFYTSLLDAANDFRVKKTQLEGVRYAVFGLGNSLYKDNFNRVARDIDIALAGLSAVRVSPVVLGDENVQSSAHGSLEADFSAWAEALWLDLSSGQRSYQLSYDDSDEEAEAEEEDGEGEEDGGEGLVDLEDMGTFMKKAKVR